MTEAGEADFRLPGSVERRAAPSAAVSKAVETVSLLSAGISGFLAVLAESLVGLVGPRNLIKKNFPQCSSLRSNRQG